jgi:WD40 repeat protein
MGKIGIISENGVDVLEGHQATVSDLQFNRGSEFLLSSGYDGKSMLWNLQSVNQKQVVLSDFGGWVMQAAFDPNGTDMVMADATGQLASFPLKMDFFANNLCHDIREGMYPKEWETFVGPDIPYAKTCPNK